MKSLLVALVLAASLSPALADANLDALVKAYPDFVAGYDAKDLILKNGTRIPIADGIATKTAAQRLDNADINDMFDAIYPRGTSFPVPETVADDPGRVRNSALFTAMYGDCAKGQVKMRAVAWLPKLHGGSVQVTTANGVADQLEAVSKDLQDLPEKFRPYLMPSAGTYNCRTIAGTDRKSMHSYAAAIDINVKFADYWRFGGATKETDKVTWKSRIPMEIVAIFEKHGFIWGGKWYHYDTMHFEYRPEILATAKAMRADGGGAVVMPATVAPAASVEAAKPALAPDVPTAAAADAPETPEPVVTTPPPVDTPKPAEKPAMPSAAPAGEAAPAAAEPVKPVVPLPDALPKPIKKTKLLPPKPGKAKKEK
jgi:hypothetical protein